MLRAYDYWSKANKEILKLFEGCVRSRVTCSKCNISSPTWDDFMVLKLCLEDQLLCTKGSVSIEDLISMWKNEEDLDGDNGYRCMNCKVPTKAVKKLEISSAPPILVTQIKRFHYTTEGKGKKLTKPVEFDDKLKIVVDTLHGGTKLATYNLKAVISHIGDEISGGHYTATTRLDVSSETWHNYSDEVYKPICSKQVQKQQAYLLFYEKAKNTVIEKVENDFSLNTLSLLNFHYDPPNKLIFEVFI